MSFSRCASQVELRGLPPTRDSAWREGEVGSTPESGTNPCSSAVPQLAVPPLLMCFFRMWCLPAQQDSVFLMEDIHCITQLTEARILCFRCCPGGWRSYWAVREVAGSCFLLQDSWPLTPSWHLGQDWGQQHCPCSMGGPLKYRNHSPHRGPRQWTAPSAELRDEWQG